MFQQAGGKRFSDHAFRVRKSRFDNANNMEVIMNWDRIKGNWKQLKGKAQEEWGELTNDELDQIEGEREQMVGRIQERYGIAKDEAERQVDDWANRNAA